MPVDWSKYPEDWGAIALEVKEAAGWKCKICGKQCRRPGEKFDTHKRTLTVHHPNHDPGNRFAVLQAACAPCHLREEAKHKREVKNRDQLQLGFMTAGTQSV